MITNLCRSPNACGCVALLVSGLKAKNQPSTPFRLKTAVVNTGKQVDDPMQVGFIQVDQAWEYLQKFEDRKDLDMLFQVCNNAISSVYLALAHTAVFRLVLIDMAGNVVSTCVN